MQNGKEVKEQRCQIDANSYKMHIQFINQSAMNGSRVFEKFQPSNKRGTSKACEVCDKSFSVLLMDYEHQCKRCLRAICKQCGKTKRDVYKIGMIKNPHRLCALCTKQSDFIIDFIKSNQLKFGEDSPIIKKWMAKAPNQTEVEVEDQGNEQGGENRDMFTYEVFGEIWDAYNYSMREFVGLLTFDKTQKQVYKSVKSVYDDMLDRGYKEKLQNIAFLIIFLLCFSSPKKCSQILEHLLLMKQTVTDNKLLIQLYLKALKVEDSEIKKLSDYLNFKIKQYMGSLSVNVLSAECSIHLISRILDRSKIEQAHMLFALSVADNIKFLVKNKNSKSDCDIELVKNCNLQTYLEKQKQIAGTKVGQYIKQKKPKLTKTTSLQSPEKSISESMSSNQSPTKNDLQYYDQMSSKTKSIHDEPSKQYTDESRKTQKQFSIPKFADQKTIQQYSFSSHQCYECEKNMKRIEDLQSKLKLKEKQIENLNFKISFRRKESNDQFNMNRSRTPTYQLGNQNDAVSRLERELLQKSDQSNTMFEEMNKAKRENALLKSRIEELETTNRILKSNLSADSVSLKSTSIDFSQQQQNNRAFETLKKALDNKNKQLQEVIKKNKLLNYQIEEMQREYSIKKPQTNIGTREQLFKKVEQLSIKVNEEQAEKLRLSEELFEIKQLLKDYESKSHAQYKEPPQSKKQKQCSIF